MANIAIYRESNKGQVSSFHHLVNTQDMENQDIKINPNKDKSNLLIYVKDGEFKEYEFYRDGNNQSDVDLLHRIEKKLDQQARKHYTEHKIKERLANPDKKIRTVLQSQDLKKEFVIAIGGDGKVDESTFADKIKQTVDAVMDAKGLERGNIIGVFIHRDESKTHVHCQYNDYSKKHGTTATQHARPKLTKGMPKKTKSDLVKLQREEFGQFQDIVAENLGMQRGKKGSKTKHKSKEEHYQELAKEVTQLERKLVTVTKKLDAVQAEKSGIENSNQIINAGLESSKRELERLQRLAQIEALKLKESQKQMISTSSKIAELEQAKIDVAGSALLIHEDYLFRAVAHLTGKDKETARRDFAYSYASINPPGAKDFYQIVDEAHKRKDEIEKTLNLPSEKVR